MKRENQRTVVCLCLCMLLFCSFILQGCSSSSPSISFEELAADKEPKNISAWTWLDAIANQLADTGDGYAIKDCRYFDDGLHVQNEYSCIFQQDGSLIEMIVINGRDDMTSINALQIQDRHQNNLNVGIQNGQFLEPNRFERDPIYKDAREAGRTMILNRLCNESSAVVEEFTNYFEAEMVHDEETDQYVLTIHLLDHEGLEEAISTSRLSKAAIHFDQNWRETILLDSAGKPLSFTTDSLEGMVVPVDEQTKQAAIQLLNSENMKNLDVSAYLALTN